VTKQEPIEFLAIGHVTIDIIDGERRLGGAVSYAALAAHRLGLAVAVITAAGEDFPYWDRFEGILTKTIASPHTTQLEHTFVDGRRAQRVLELASAIRGEHLAGLPLADDAAVLYCPVVHEIEAPLVRLAPRGLSAVAPQGFFREWDETGSISMREWDEADDALARADIVCMSEHDAEVPDELAERFTGKAFVITRGRDGCRVYTGADVFDFPAAPARELDATGAGDVFAAALVIALRRNDSIPNAIGFASRAAAAAVESVGVEGLRS
jgi:sugar/nucleoside kinase (ribokinase family)